MSNYTATDFFPTWYKATKLSATPDQLKSRLAAIDELVNTNEIPFWLDIIRISNGLQPADDGSISRFVKTFQDEDNTFPLTNNAQLLKVLAASAVCFKLEAEDLETEDEEEEEEEEEEEQGEPNDQSEEADASVITDVNTAISLCVTNINFLGQFKDDGTIPVLTYAQNYLESKPYYQRMREHEGQAEDLDKVAEKFNTTTALNKDDHQVIVNSIQQVQKENNMLSEELNVLSWIFGEYSKLANCFFQDAGTSLMMIYGPIELHEKTSTLHYINSARGFLHRILSIALASKKATPVSVADSINAIPADFKTSLVKKYKAHISELTPYLFAVSKSTEVNAGDDYAAPVKKQTNGGDIKKTFKPDVMAIQIYKEIVFINTLENV